KFNGMVDEVFLVGYSVNSKAFRVFNSRTRIVQETLHINFLENKPNGTGSGPTWLFDIDTLTKTTNYQPVTAGNQSNPSACVQKKLMQKKQGRIVFNNMCFFVWSSGSINPQNTDDDVDIRGKKPEFEEDVGAEADFTNLETTIIVSPIKTTRVHKDHPVIQIIGDLSSATQTRSMTRVAKD
nr:retrovirus-related Pol polyprotein from transposon TNT 1-94 [Tanacetum cinerariifolium]